MQWLVRSSLLVHRRLIYIALQSPPEELQLAENGTVMTRRTPLDLPLSRVNFIDTEVTIEGSNPAVRRGVKFGNGDGTVPTLSLGLMCRKWNTDKRWNPAGIPVVTQEFEHNPETFDLRGGATTGDHIDVLGSTPLNEAVMRIGEAWPLLAAASKLTPLANSCRSRPSGSRQHSIGYR